MKVVSKRQKDYPQNISKTAKKIARTKTTPSQKVNMQCGIPHRNKKHTFNYSLVPHRIKMNHFNGIKGF